MAIRKTVKRSLKMCIDCDLNPVTLMIRVIKEDLHKLLDYIIPDDDEKT